MRWTWLALVVCASAPAMAQEVVPPPPGLQLGIRTGFILPFGKMDSGAADISDSMSGQIPIWLDAGYRVSPQVSLGLYGQVGFALVKNCPSGVSCSSKNWRFGANVHYHIQPTSKIDPWLGLGFGYEIFTLDASSGGQSVSATGKGWEFANLQAGVDFWVSDRAYLGPFVGFSFDEITSESGDILGMHVDTSDFDKSLHEWLFLGVRGRFDL